MGRRLKILFICSENIRLGGAALSLADMLVGLVDIADPVLLFRSRGPVFDYFHERGYCCIVRRFKLLTTSKMPNSCLLPLINFKHRVENYLCVRNVRKQLMRLGVDHIDIVHSNSGVIGIGQELANLLGAKHVWHLRELADTLFNFTAGKEDFYARIKASDAVLAISQTVYSHFSLSQHRRAVVIRDTISLPQGKVTDGTVTEGKVGDGKVTDKYILFCSSSVTEIKGASDAVEIFCLSSLPSRGYSLKMTGPCSPEYKEELMSIAKRYGCQDKIELTGFVDNLLALFSGASLLLQCSRNEALGRVTVEAMLLGIPVLGRAVGGTSELLLDKSSKRGWLFHDVSEAVNILNSLPSSDFTDRIRSAKTFAQKEFSPEGYISKLMAFYNLVLED